MSKLQDLNKLLSEDLSIAKQRAEITFDELAGNNWDGVIIFGAGDLGKRTQEGLKKVGLKAVRFSDNNSKIWDSEINGLKILSLYNALQNYPKAIVVLTIWSANMGHPINEVKHQLNTISKETKLISFIYLYWKFPEVFLPYWRCNLPHKTIEQFELVSSAYELWSDDLSREEYFGQVYWRITGDSSKLTTPVKEEQYFPEDIFKVKNTEVFVDIGAFDGDTLKIFLKKSKQNFKHYYAYEPDPFGYNKFKENQKKLLEDIYHKITIEPIGVGNKKEKISIETPGLYFKILYAEEARIQAQLNINTHVDVESMPLNEIDFEHAPTFIKMDVEGYEPNVIMGANEIIKKHEPIIAISIYHKYDHLWKLPLAVNALGKNYNFYLRPHFHAGWELICYAVPKSRVLVKT